MAFFRVLTVGNFKISRAFSLNNKLMTSITFEKGEMLLQPLSESFKSISHKTNSPVELINVPTSTSCKSGPMEALRHITVAELIEAAQCIKEQLPHSNLPSAIPFAIEAIRVLYLYVLDQIPRCPLRLSKSDSLEQPATLLKIHRKRQDLLLEVARALVNSPVKGDSSSVFSKTLATCRQQLDWSSSALITRYPAHVQSLDFNQEKPGPSPLGETPSKSTLGTQPWVQLDPISKLIPEQVTRPLSNQPFDAESILHSIESIEHQLHRLKEQVLLYRNKQIFHRQNIKRNVNPFEEMI